MLKQRLNGRYERYFIRSGSRWPHTGVKLRGTVPHYLPFPFFLAYSASLLRDEGFEVHVIDSVALDLDEAGFIDKARYIKPDLIFYEVPTPTSEYDLILAAKLKKTLSDVIIVLGGTHATTFSCEILTLNNSVDFILKGEYELSLLSLVKAIRDGQNEFQAGVVYKKDGTIVDMGNSLLIEPLERLPFPARDIFPSNNSPDPLIYWDGFCQSYPAIQMHSSRGCPHRCYFCVWNQVMYNNGKYRTFAAKRVVDEMEENVNRYGAKEIYFDDDDFTVSRTHVFAICDEIVRRGLRIKWSCMGNAANLDEEVVKKMSHAGCVGIKFGVESGSPKILKGIGKQVNLENVRNVARICVKYRIKSHATFALGLLGETGEDIKRTMKFAESLPVNSLQVSIATPFPGTSFFAAAQKAGFLRSREWRLYDGKTREVVAYPSLDWREVESLRRKGLRAWFLNILISPSRFIGQFYILFRTIKGLGFFFFVNKLHSTIIDELKNR